MNEHLDAIKADLAFLAYPTWRYWADEVTGQYLVLSAPAWDRPEEPAIGPNDDLDTQLRIKAVAGTTTGVVTMLRKIREQLSPQQLEHQVPMAGRIVRTRYVRSEFVDVDRDAVIVGTNRHPAVGVDTYRLLSEPT